MEMKVISHHQPFLVEQRESDSRPEDVGEAAAHAGGIHFLWRRKNFY